MCIGAARLADRNSHYSIKGIAQLPIRAARLDNRAGLLNARNIYTEYTGGAASMAGAYVHTLAGAAGAWFIRTPSQTIGIVLLFCIACVEHSGTYSLYLG